MKQCEMCLLVKCQKYVNCLLIVLAALFICGLYVACANADDISEEAATTDTIPSSSYVDQSIDEVEGYSVDMKDAGSEEITSAPVESGEVDEVDEVDEADTDSTDSSSEPIKISRKENLTVGSTGSQFEELKGKLKKLGYLPESYNSSSYDETMKEAVALFQLYNGITDPDGIVGEQSEVLLNGNPASYSDMNIGDKNSRVLWIQNKLNHMGYLTVTPDGVWGKKSVEAIRLLNMYKYGSDKSSSLLERLYLLFNSDDLSINNISGLIKNGDSDNPDIKKARIRLYQAGFIKLDSSLNEVFDDELELAVRAYQLSGGIADDGMIGNWTSSHLNRMAVYYSSINYGEHSQRVYRLQELLKDDGFFNGRTDYVFGNYTRNCVSLANSLLGYQKTESADLNLLLGLLAINKYKGMPNLSVGDAGSQVDQVCKKLIDFGYLDKDACSGTYNTSVQMAVRVFQVLNGISTPDGIVGRLTRARLYSNPVSFHKFKYGEKSAAAKITQTYLYDHGFLAVMPDGIWGAKSDKGLELWQKTLDNNGSFLDFIDSVATNKGPYINKIAPTYDLGSNPKIIRNVKMRLYLFGLWDDEFTGVYSNILKYRIGTLQILGGIVPDCILGNWTSNYLNQNHNFSDFTANRESVYGIQLTLDSNGCMNVNPDGIYGNKTIAGLNLFCELSGLSKFSGINLKILDKLAEVRNLFRQLSINPGGLYSKGITSDAVKVIQNDLIDSNYGNFNSDGIFGALTKGAVVAFQLDNGLSGDGIVGTKTLYKLFVSQHKSYTDKTVGDQGDFILALQKQLLKLGYLSATPDGIFGNKTKSAVMNFQKVYGIPETGVANNTTVQKLFSLERLLGIDVSYAQGVINWSKVVQSGIEFAFIRAGGRFWGSGKIYTDSYFSSNIKGALAAGLNVGVYFFTQAVNEAEAINEARTTLNLIRGYSVTLPVVIDTESTGDSSGPGRHNTIDVATRTRVIKAFCETVKNAGYTPMIYGSTSWLNNNLIMSQLKDYKVWVAQWANSVTYSGDYYCWQYTSRGSVNGINGRVDMDYIYP